jgi:hypothetical protein
MNRNQNKDHANEEKEVADKKTGDKSKDNKEKTAKRDGNDETVLGDINGEAKNETK